MKPGTCLRTPAASLVLAASCLTACATTTYGAVLDAHIATARADATKRSGLPERLVTLLDAGPVTWPDGSMGCPKPGLAYTQALVPGYRIRLRVGEAAWSYHASERVAPFHCPPGQAREPAPVPGRQ
jgi:hypothetical protein